MAIDDMKKLARMQEVLLSRTSINREENLKKYVDIIRKLDEDSFSNLVSEINKFGNHNQPLDEELNRLKDIRDFYNKVNDQQLSYKKICEMYGYNRLKLTDLSRIDIEYINSRINAIDGYLVNQKDIDIYKVKLEKLNDRLVIEEKNNERLNKKIIDLEERLRENFINASGRIIVDGKVQYISVASEYEDLGYDFKNLINNVDEINKLLSVVKDELKEKDEKLRVASICYRNVPNDTNRQIYEEINLEYLSVNYRLIMLEILNLVFNYYDKYGLVKNKRLDLLNFIKYRTECLEKLNIKFSVDPFTYTKVSEQFEMISSMEDYSINVSNLKRDIASVSDKLDKMILQNNVYLSSINYRKDLMDLNIINNTYKTDFNVIKNDSKKYILDNQIVKMKDISLKFNLDVVRKKTKCVIKRVSEMMISSVKKEENNTFNPDLVIVMDNLDNVENNNSIEISENIEVDKPIELEFSSNLENVFVDDDLSDKEFVSSNEVTIDVTNEIDMFKTVEPFNDVSLFTDKIDDTDDEIFVDTNTVFVENKEVKVEKDNTLNILDNNKVLEGEKVIPIEDNVELEELPDVFWVTQTDTDDDSSDSSETALSFDEQINVLLASDGKVAA